MSNKNVLLFLTISTLEFLNVPPIDDGTKLAASATKALLPSTSSLTFTKNELGFSIDS